MNESLLTADRMTHMKIVALSLVCAIFIVTIGVMARMSDMREANAQPPFHSVGMSSR